MLWPRDTCPFGLPDDVDLGEAPVGELVLTSIGHVLRATAVDIVDAPLPLQLATLLRRLAAPVLAGAFRALPAVSPHPARPIGGRRALAFKTCRAPAWPRRTCGPYPRAGRR